MNSTIQAGDYIPMKEPRICVMVSK